MEEKIYGLIYESFILSIAKLVGDIMKKIALIIPDLYTGGMSRVLENLSNEFSKDEYEQYIILLKKKK